MTTTAPLHRAIALAVLALTSATFAQPAPLDKPPQRLYVPYSDLAALLDPAGKTILMDRAEFAKLLAAAKEKAPADEPAARIAQIVDAQYVATVAGDKVALTGTLAVTSGSDQPVAMPLGFGQVGLTELLMDDKPAPVGRDDQGRLVLVVTGKGKHTLAVRGAGALKDIASGGSQFGLTLPAAVAGSLKLSAPGDLEIHSTVPVVQTRFDKATDRTQAELAVGGQSSLTVLLAGNGRQEDQRAILLCESTTNVQLTTSSQVLNCLQTVQVLRRSTRELRFTLPIEWTVTDVSSPNMNKWSIEAGKGGAPQTLVVQLANAGRGSQLIHIQASAPMASTSAWQGPAVRLVGADFQHGYLIVDTGEHLRIRGQKLTDARQEDLSAAAGAAQFIGTPVGRLIYHWGDKWSASLDLATIGLRRASDEQQTFSVGPQQVSLACQFKITAIGREMYDVQFDLPDAKSGWEVSGVTVNDSAGGFEYHVDDAKDGRVLKIQLATPLRADGMAKVSISLRHVPADWDWTAADNTRSRELSVPLVRPQVDTVTGLASVAASGDLEVDEDDVDIEAGVGPYLKRLTVGRMA
ncbi:MAG: hypothetical protein PHU85_12460, partial [Phycisphaerae bacterium]|nr:hypothetical protein [Phycisphaerae bacterium]